MTSESIASNIIKGQPGYRKTRFGLTFEDTAAHPAFIPLAKMLCNHTCIPGNRATPKGPHRKSRKRLTKSLPKSSSFEDSYPITGYLSSLPSSSGSLFLEFRLNKADSPAYGDLASGLPNHFSRHLFGCTFRMSRPLYHLGPLSVRQKYWAGCIPVESSNRVSSLFDNSSCGHLHTVPGIFESTDQLCACSDHAGKSPAS